MLFCLLVYLFSAVGSFVYFGLHYDLIKEHSVKSDMTLEEYHAMNLAKRDFFMKHPEPYLWDFLTDTLISVIRIVSGIILGIAPVILLIFDGIQTGTSVLLSLFEDSLIGIIFHFLFKISYVLAGIIASTLGISLFLSLLKSKNRTKNIINAAKNSLIIFITIIIPLLLLAAIFNWLSLIIYF